ncbi:MAG: hypothetical protein LBK23_02080 [Oscillospiraceae bacterium]|jgi:hypothetical protein|nr:hypothetical protein [Oscillospiraceae bacterium]
MLRWFGVTKNQYIGLFALGFAFFVLQELPYIVMPLIPLQANPLMEMQDKSIVLNVFEKTLGISCIVTMLFLVRGDAKWFSLRTSGEIVFFSVAMAAIAGYFVGWIFYFNGFQTLPVILCFLVALPPIYYAFIGLWRGNYVLAVLGGAFLTAHLSNVWNNLK